MRAFIILSMMLKKLEKLFMMANYLELKIISNCTEASFREWKEKQSQIFKIDS